MLRWDRRLESWIASHRVGWLDEPFRIVTWSGTWGAIWLVLGVVAALRLRRRQVLVWVAAADLAAQLSTILIQHAVGRARPSVHALVAEPHSHSFPSGHAVSSFACAVVLASFAPRWRIPLYALATLVAFSRLYVGVHFPLDAIGGAAWGFVLARALLDFRRPVRRLAGARDPRRPAGGRRGSRPGRRPG